MKTEIEILKNRIESFAGKLEEDEDFEMSDEMQDEYFAIKEEIEINIDNPYLHIEILKLKKQFEKLWRTYENPDNLSNDMMNMMFPNED
jgi:hypothetical protein